MRCHMKEAHEDSRDDLGFLCHECQTFCPSLTDIIRHQCAGQLNALAKYGERKGKNLNKIMKKGLKQIVQTKSVLTKRFKRHRSQQSSSKSCDICFFKTQDMNNHMKVAHESSGEVVCFSCPDCGKVFSRLTESVKHKCSDQEGNESGFEESLGLSESSELLLLEKPLIKIDPEEVHMSSDMLNELVGTTEKLGKDFTKCNVCKDGFEGKADLVRHRSLRHQFPCKICFKKFPLMLAAHYDAKSLQDGWLQGHMKTTHTL